MKFGACIALRLENYDQAKHLTEQGFDYIETNMATIYEMSDEEVDTLAKRMQEDGVHLHSANCMFPGWIFENGIHLIGPESSIEWQNEFLDKVYPRCQKLGLKTIVFGSGKQRRIPDGMDPKEGYTALLEVGRRIAEKAAEYGITLVLEPLNYTETNCFNRVGEGYAFMKEVNRPGLKLLADVYHMYANGEAPELPAEYVKELHHIHLAQPETREQPSELTPYFTAFAENLKKNGYDGYASVEARGSMDGKEKQILDVVKALFN